jgi:hypothetical protein
MTSLRLYEMQAFASGFRQFFRDRFGFRGLLIKSRSRLLVLGLGVSSNPSVVVGKEGWLFTTRERSIENFTRTIPYAPDELERMAHTLERRADWLATRNAKYVYIVAPAKETIYPQFMPDYLQRQRHDAPSRLDQLAARFAGSRKLLLVDLRPALVAASERERVYHLTDSHWNDRGAFAAYQATVNAMIEWGVNLQRPLPRSAFADSVVRRSGMDLAGMLGLEDLISEDDLRLEHPIELNWENGQASLDLLGDASGAPRVVIFGDSFLPALAPYFANHFRGICVSSEPFNPTVITPLAPSLVIEEFAERKLTFPPPAAEEHLDASSTTPGP